MRSRPECELEIYDGLAACTADLMYITTERISFAR
jgi:hypothetical protein